MSAKDIVLETPRLDIGALEWGSETDRPLLAFHGWLDNAASFVPMAPYLEGRHLVALDTPGHGASGHRPPGMAYYFVDYVADMIAAADALGWEQFDLVGHSLGGAIATFVAGLFPERVQRLVLIEGLGPMVKDPEKAPDYMAESLDQMNRLRAREKTRKPAVYKDPAVAVAARSKIGDISEESARLLVIRNMRETAQGWVWRSDPRLRQRSPMYLTEAQVVAFVKRITCPVLLIRGTESGFADRDTVVSRQDVVQNLEIVDLPGQHHLHMEDPQSSAAAIMQFLT